MEYAVGTDPRVDAAREQYRECMDSSGYQVADVQSIFVETMEEEEELGDLAGTGPESQALQLLAEFDAYKEAALVAHDTCVGPFYEIEESVRQAYFDKHPMLP